MTFHQNPSDRQAKFAAETAVNFLLRYSDGDAVALTVVHRKGQVRQLVIRRRFAAEAIWRR